MAVLVFFRNRGLASHVRCVRCRSAADRYSLNVAITNIAEVAKGEVQAQPSKLDGLLDLRLF
jgi:hypothetical protein